MSNYDDHHYVSELVRVAQGADEDLRQEARDSMLFINKKDGQWEPYWWNLNQGKPRYTFDMTSPVVDQIAGEMEQADFDITVSPASGDASKDDAKTLDGMIRNIENMSNASHIFNNAARNMVTTGMDGWRVVQKYVDDDSFDQDLVIEKISNFLDRVWFDDASEKQDRSDARWAVVMQGLLKDDYEARWPEGSGSSVSEDRQGQAYYDKPDLIMVGEFLYKEPYDRELVQMDNGQVLEVNDDFEKIADELAALGINEKSRRKREAHKVYSRFYDASGWLEPAKETVFSYIPVIPTYGNFNIFENKALYCGAVRPLMDYQRVYNYTESRAITETALAPRAKIPMTTKMMAGFIDELSTLNVDDSPILPFNPDPELQGYIPQQVGGAQVNAGLATISMSMKDGMARSAGMFAANMGEGINGQSGVAIKALQDKGSTGTIKYFGAQEIAICHTAKILVDAIPKVYDAERQVRILGADGSISMAVLNQVVQDQQTGEVVKLNDLSKGKYDVVCSSGPAFKNRQDETVASIMEMAALDPTVIQENADVLFNNITAPGMDLIAERKRERLFGAGMIPESQMTDEEKQQMQLMEQQQEQQGQQPDALMVAAQAEMAKAQAEQEKVNMAREKAAMDFQAKQGELQLKAQQQQIDAQKAEMDMQAKYMELQRKEQELQFKAYQQEQASQLSRAKTISDIDNTGADTDKKAAETAKIMAETGVILDEASIKSMPTDEIVRLLS